MKTLQSLRCPITLRCPICKCEFETAVDVTKGESIQNGNFAVCYLCENVLKLENGKLVLTDQTPVELFPDLALVREALAEEKQVLGI